VRSPYAALRGLEVRIPGHVFGEKEHDIYFPATIEGKDSGRARSVVVKFKVRAFW